ncbi:hypothetical protein ANN_24475 [Periplaneta americana]|uniref:G-protein coupled receptors family 2 profile 2 domain-containing protein n=1 Tax=Periplaneta americana TaxID=6978 RepID=A0ABQ8S384_PERAM|nr:hypothetical protein ANN_24475 [Periplaneta americana]
MIRTEDVYFFLKMSRENLKADTARMVMRCPRDALTKISDACMVANRTSPNFHYTMDVPVLSSVSGVWYRNVYCAVCNGDAKHLAPVLEEGKYTENLRWILGPTTCQLKVKLLPTSTTGFLRPCGKTCAKKKIILIEDCPPSWTDMDIARKCRGYAFYTKLRKNVYKNPHCAMCNGVSTEDLMPWLNTCSDSLFKTRVMPSYAIILDFMGNGGEDEAYRLCQPPNGVWDVIEETCIEIISSVRSGRMLNETCPKIKLMKSEFQTLDNGSLEYTGNNSRYIGQIFNSFEILENETAIVCDLNRVDEEEDIIILSQGYLTEFCLSISVICLFLHIIIYCALPKLRNLPGKNLLALSCALLLAQFGFLIGITPKFEVSKAVCVGIASLEYFCFLAAFFWMNIMSVDIWRTFSGSMLRGSGGLKTYRKYSGYAWGIPAFLVLLALTVDLTSDDGAVKPWFGKEGVCWFGSPGGLGLFFALPVFILLVMDSGLFIFTVYKIWHTKLQGSSYIQNKAKTELIQTSSRNSSDTKTSLKIRGSSAGMCGRKDQVRFYLYLKLFTIMGLTWIFGFIAALGNQPILWYPFIIFNGLQGAFIFVMFDMKRKIGHMLWDKYVTGHGYQPPGMTISLQYAVKFNVFYV